MTTKQTITKNPSGDLCQHGAYADLCITCHPQDDETVQAATEEVEAK